MAKKQPVDDWVDVDSSDSNEWEDIDDSPSSKPSLFSNVKSGSSASPSAFANQFDDYGLPRLYGPKTEKLLATPLLPESSGAEPDTWMGGFGRGLYEEFARPMSSPRSIAQDVLTGGTVGKLAGKFDNMLPVKKPGLSSIMPETDASLAALTNQRLLDLEHTANQTIKNTPNEVAKRQASGVPTSAPRQEPSILDTLQEPKKPKKSKLDKSIGRIEDEIPPEMMESFNSVDEGISPNASGESAASGEALSRQEGMRSRGESYIVYDKAGVARNLIGPEAVDYQPRPGETYGIKTPRGFVQLNNNGGMVPPTTKTITPRGRVEYPGFKGTEPGPPVGDVTGLRGRLDDALEMPPDNAPGGYTGPMDERGINAELERLRAAKSQTVIDVGDVAPESGLQVNANNNDLAPVANSITKIDPDAKIQYNSTNDAVAIQSSKGATRKNFGRGDVEQQLIHTPGIQEKFPASGVDPTGRWFILAKDENAFNRLVDELPDTPQTRPKPGETGIANEMSEGRRQTATQGNEPPRPPKRDASEFGPEDFNKEIKPLADTIEDVADLPNGPEKEGIIRKTNNAMRSLLTTWDFSAPGRQGKAFLMNKAYWTSLDDMVKAWGSEGAAKTIKESIDNHPSGYFKQGVSETGKPLPSFAERAGLDMSTSEEVFKATFGETLKKYSGINKSSRAHTAFLNKLRSDQFVSFMDQAKKVGRDGETNPLVAKQFAEFINNATGRGSLNVKKWKLERNAGALSDVFFAPKNLSGQIRTWNTILNPYRYYTADPILRKQALKSLFAIAGTGMAVGELAKMAGGDVSNDPTNTDFRKIKVGDTRIDLFGGYQQFPVAAMRLLLGKSTSPSGRESDLTAGKFGMPSRASVAERFFTNRLSPLPAFVWAWMNNKEFDGKPFEIKKGLYERALPIAINDMIDLAKEDPKLAAILSPLLVTGMAGTQTYTRE